MERLFNKVHDSDPLVSGGVVSRITSRRCIHCEQKRESGEVVYYTLLSNGNLIWWHNHHINDYD